MNKIYELQACRALEVQGSFEYIGEYQGKIYVRGNGLKKPFVSSSLPESLGINHSLNLQNAREAKKQEFTAQCDERLLHFSSLALGENHIYDMSLEDQINLMGAIIVGNDAPVRCAKEGEEKANILHTKKQLQQVYEECIAYKNDVLNICAMLKSYLNSLDSLEAINALTWEDYEEIKEIKSE